jgi:hypothetical protein
MFLIAQYNPPGGCNLVGEIPYSSQNYKRKTSDMQVNLSRFWIKKQPTKRLSGLIFWIYSIANTTLYSYSSELIAGSPKYTAVKVLSSPNK